MTTPNANDLLMSGGGVKSAKFDNLGDVVRGTIAEDPKVRQVRKWDEKAKSYSDELEFWPSGDPMYEIVVILRTELRDDPEDDGRRTLHITPRIQPAVRDAVKAAGAKGLALGGVIAVQWSSGAGTSTGGAKQYTAAYQPPQLDPGSLLGGNTTPAAPAPAVQQPAALADPGATTAPAAAPGGLLGTPTVATAAAPPGIDPAAWAAFPDHQKAAVLAAMGQQPGF